MFATFSPAYAQAVSLNALPTPNVELLRQGRVLEMEPLSDGKLLIAGDFIRVGTQPRPGIARLNLNRTLDTSYMPSVEVGFGVQQIMTDASGRTYLLNSATLRRLTADGALDSAFPQLGFNPTFARSMALVSDGVIVGGNFSSVGLADVPRLGLVKIRFDGSVDLNFIVSAPDVMAVVAVSDSEVLITGGFTAVAGVARTGTARVGTSSAGSVNSAWNPSISNGALALRVDDALISGGSVYLTGSFTTVDGVARAHLAKLALANGALDSLWNISAPTLINARLFQHNGSLLVSSASTTAYANPPAAAVPGRRLLRAALTGTGSIDIGFAPVPVEDAVSTAVAVAPADSAARLVLGGNFLSIGTSARFALAQLNADGSVDSVSAVTEAFALGNVSQIQMNPSTQQIYLSGDFLRADGAALRYCLRLSANGAVDTNWRPQTGNRRNIPFALVPGTGVFVATSVGIARLNEVDGLPIASWVNSTQSVISLLPANAAIYVASGTQLLRFALASNGALDAGFAPATNGTVDQLRFDAPGNSLLVSGAFSQIGGAARAHLARINANTGALIASFDPTFTIASGAIVSPQGFDLDPAGGVWIAGNFDSVNGALRASTVRVLLSNGDVDPASAGSPASTFNNGLSFSDGLFYGWRTTNGGNAEVKRVPTAGGAAESSWRVVTTGVPSVAVFDADRVLLSGRFTRIGDSPRLGLASLAKIELLLRDGFE
jgi:Domain of unknown function (DUF5122) beta-propeller